MGRPKNPLNTLHKICPTCKKEFTCERRKEKTYCCKTCATNSEEVKEKNRNGVKKTFDSKYGGHPMATNVATKEKFNETMLENHGVAWASQMPDFSDKVKTTLKDRYGDENYNNTEQRKETCIEKYGEDNYTKTDEYRKQYTETCMKKYGVPHVSQIPFIKTGESMEAFRHSHKLTMFKKFYQSEKFKDFIPLFNMDEYDGVTVRYNKNYKFKCKRCNGEHEYDLTKQYLRCPVCDKSISTFQSDVIDYVKSILPNDPVIVNNRVILSPLELDIYLPNRNVAIETDGIYYHSEVSGSKNKNYHLTKTKLCATKGIRLLHVFENEWKGNKDIVKSVLKNILCPSVSDVSIDDCVITEIDEKKKSKFLLENHLDGNENSMVRVGLFHREELISVMTFVSSKFDKTVEWEMIRYCSKANVDGGINRMFEHFVKIYKPTKIAAYSDRRYFTGESYIKLGFQFVENTPPTYHYIIDAYDTLESKNNWQKCKLEKKLLSFDENLTEWENMKMNGFDRIWDCGNSKWIWFDKSIKTITV